MIKVKLITETYLEVVLRIEIFAFILIDLRFHLNLCICYMYLFVKEINLKLEIVSFLK